MKSHNTLLPSSSEDSSSSTPLLHNGSHPRRHRNELLLIVCGLLLLASLIAFSGYRASNVRVPHADVSSSTTSCETPNSKTVLSSKWKPVSRGVSAGVSEKSNNKLFGCKAGTPESFPWNNSMLSWQRTAFIFSQRRTG
ncbi:Beta-fructofuranosidase [Sesbania bispinosa]|nr:Beta-fructofuranosidase [Sesbania bispinosa]